MIKLVSTHITVRIMRWFHCVLHWNSQIQVVFHNQQSNMNPIIQHYTILINHPWNISSLPINYFFLLVRNRFFGSICHQFKRLEITKIHNYTHVVYIYAKWWNNIKWSFFLYLSACKILIESIKWTSVHFKSSHNTKQTTVHPNFRKHCIS